MGQGKRSSILLLTSLAGVALILFSFFYLIEPALRTRVAWLDLGVVLAVFLVNAGNGLLLAWRREEFQRQVAAVGVLWLLDFLYSAAALGLLAAGLALGLPFKLQVVGQLACLFLVLVVGGWAVTARETAEEVRQRGEDSLARLGAIRREFERLVVALGGAGPAGTGALPRLQRCQEQMRYLAPVDSAEALQLEDELRELLAGLGRLLAVPGPREELLRQDLAAALERVESNIKLRKGCRAA